MAFFLKIFLVVQLLLPGFVHGPVDICTVGSWDKETLEKANTAKHAAYLTKEEQDIIFYTNLARINGPLFLETYLNGFLEKGNIKKSKYVASLRKDLQKSPSMEPLQPQPDLFHIAKGHALISGKKGTMGHKDFQKRTKQVLPKYKVVAENCQYGYPDGLSIVLDLLIDEGIEDLGHRKNILNQNYSNVGVSIQPHKKFNVNSVMVFGGTDFQ